MHVEPSHRPAAPARVARLLLATSLMLASASRSHAATLLFDFGAPDSPSGGASQGTAQHWNNFPASLGGTEGSEVPGLVSTTGEASALALQIVSRFNGANESGATSGGPYPASGTRDSLFGNTELFGSLENLTPAFKVYGFEPGASCTLTFYASRLGVADNRQTRFTVTGAQTAFVDLDAANNVTNVVRLAGIAADASGEVLVELSAGPNNNNANHFTYLGVLGIETTGGTRYLVDFGSDGAPTETEEPSPGASWNNVTSDIGINPQGRLADLVTTNGTATGAALQMIARFNGANLNGSTTATVFPTSATRDSLFGNTAAFSGLENIFPSFKLTGLSTSNRYAFHFYGSRTGVTDHRETRYTVTGATTAFADLDAANNVDRTATVHGMVPSAAGEIVVTLGPGPNNNNGNRFTYLGALRVESTPIVPPGFLVDFGATGSQTLGGTEFAWNNVTAEFGANPASVLDPLVGFDGSPSSIALRMVSRFNGANENGVTTEAPFPVSATRDSLFGNTEIFSELENITPVFNLTGLNPTTAYTLEFYASRLGVGDNRETRYTVQGATESSVDLNVANNETEIARLEGVKPSAAGILNIALSPGPNNDNGNHFVYLGVLRVTWTAPTAAEPARFASPVRVGSSFRFQLSGTTGATYRILGSSTLREWSEIRSVTLAPGSTTVDLEVSEAYRFFQAVAFP